MGTVSNIPIKLDQSIHDYKLFVDNQVLTSNQLNTMLRYLDQQQRLTRTNMIGIGVMCGLVPSLVGNTIFVTKGAGNSSDGDLMRLERDFAYTHFRLFQDQRAQYPTWQDSGQTTGQTGQVPLFELLEGASETETSFALSDFNTTIDDLFPGSGLQLANMVCVFYLEAYLEDEEDCADGNCDNIGPDQRQTPRMLLVPQSVLTADQDCIADFGLPPLSLNKVVLDSQTLDTQAEFNQAYKDAINNSIPIIQAGLHEIQSKFAPFLEGLYDSNPVPDWIDKLKDLILTDPAAGIPPGIQYRYDFLRDLVDAYHEFAEEAMESCISCCPAPGGFPKHLMVGELSPTQTVRPLRFRHHFQPNPQINFGDLGVRKIRSLHKRLDLMIRGYEPNLTNSRRPIRLTPSKRASTPLSQCPIPIYYNVHLTPNDHPLYDHWNPKLGLRRQGSFTYGYRAQGGIGFGNGAASDPMAADTDAYDFFRVEGHIGKSVSDVQQELENLDVELPFTVEFIELGNTPRNIRPRKPWIFPELDLGHRLKANELWERFEVAEKYADAIRVEASNSDSESPWNQYIEPRNGGVFGTSQVGNRFHLQEIATSNTQKFKSDIGEIKTHLRASINNFPFDGFNEKYKTIQVGLGTFNGQLKRGIQSSAVTPFENLTSTINPNILNLVKKWRENKEEKVQEQYLFKNLLQEHPSLSHLGGSSRGGTLILVYEGSDDTVVGDFYLSFPFQPDLNLEDDIDDDTNRSDPTVTLPLNPWINFNDFVVDLNVTPYQIPNQFENLKQNLKINPDEILGIEGFKNRMNNVTFWHDVAEKGFINYENAYKPILDTINTGGFNLNTGGDLLVPGGAMGAGLLERRNRINELHERFDSLNPDERNEYNFLVQTYDRQVTDVVEYLGRKDKDFTLSSGDTALLQHTISMVSSLNNEIGLSAAHSAVAKLEDRGNKRMLFNNFSGVNFGGGLPIHT